MGIMGRMGNDLQNDVSRDCGKGKYCPELVQGLSKMWEEEVQND